MSLRSCLFCLGLALAASASMLTASPARADTTAVTGLGSYNSVLEDSYTMGWTFTPSANITVTQLGWWDKDSDGLNASHDVGIWSIGGGPVLGTGTVGFGASGALDNGFRYTTLGMPINLIAGQSYVIGGTSDHDEWAYDVMGRTTSPDITIGQSQFVVSNTPGVLQFPTDHYAPVNDAYYGPNFKYNLTGGAAVPEPGAYAMGAGMAFSAVLALRRRRAAK